MYVSPHDKATEYRRPAEEALALAGKVSNQDARSHLLEAATHLKLLAAKEDRRPGEAWTRPEPSPDPHFRPSPNQAAPRRFFFDTDDGEVLVIDEIGVELKDLEAAKAEARAALANMAKNRLPNGNQRDFAAIVRDESGQAVLRVNLSLTVHYATGLPT